MDKNEAIAILEAQSHKLETINHADFKGWLSQTKSYYSDFFGKESEEYLHLKNNGHFPNCVECNDDEILFSRNQHLKITMNTIHAHIETLRVKGLYDPEKNTVYIKVNNNMVSDQPNKYIISGAVALFLAGASLTQFIHNIIEKNTKVPTTVSTPANSATIPDSTDKIHKKPDNTKKYENTDLDTAGIKVK